MSYVTDNPIDPRRDRRGRNLEVELISWFCHFLESFCFFFGAFPRCAAFVLAVADAWNTAFFEQDDRFTRINVDHRVWDMEHLHRSAGALLLGHRL